MNCRFNASSLTCTQLDGTSCLLYVISDDMKDGFRYNAPNHFHRCQWGGHLDFIKSNLPTPGKDTAHMRQLEKKCIVFSSDRHPDQKGLLLCWFVEQQNG